MGIKISCIPKVIITFASLFFCNINAHQQTYFSVYNTQPKYNDTKFFDYVNPAAPKGGAIKMSATGTFDGLNPFIVIGNNPIHIRIFCFAKLLGESPEEIGISYPYVAKSIEISDDKKTIIFHLNENATFSDGTPITAEDVVWSFNFIIKVNPMMKHYYHDVEKVEAIDSHTVCFHSKNPNNKELPGILGQIEILPSAFFKANMTENGGVNKPFPTSGPYKISKVDFGRSIIFERVKNWWGEKLPINVGLYNFDEIQLQFYRERNAAFQAFLSGNLNLWFEASAKQWYTAYDVPAVNQGKIIKTITPCGNTQATKGFVFNLRRNNLSDIRVRKAISMLFNFESLNKTMFYNEYYRLNSYYGNAELSHKGQPQGDELTLLENYKDLLPNDVFKDSYKNPSYKDNLVPREVVQQSIDLLKEAGWELKDQKLINKAGEEFVIVIPYADSASQAIILHMQRNFQVVGIKVIPRLVDASTFVEMIEQFDFDMVDQIIPQSNSLGNEQREYFGSISAKVKASKNLAGIENKVIDELIEKLVDVKDYQSMLNCSHAIDRVLSWNYYMIMGWNFNGIRIAHWDNFSMTGKTPKYLPFPILSWWTKSHQVTEVALPDIGILTKIKETIKNWFS